MAFNSITKADLVRYFKENGLASPSGGNNKEHYVSTLDQHGVTAPTVRKYLDEHQVVATRTSPRNQKSGDVKMAGTPRMKKKNQLVGAEQDKMPPQQQQQQSTAQKLADDAAAQKLAAGRRCPEVSRGRRCPEVSRGRRCPEVSRGRRCPEGIAKTTPLPRS